MWATLLIGILVLLLIWDYLNKKHRNEILRKSNIPGGVNLPLVGRALHMIGTNSESRYIYTLTYDSTTTVPIISNNSNFLWQM